MPRTVIGPETRVAGALSGKDDLVIEGTVEGPVVGEAAVLVAQGATVNGTVRGRDVTIGGRLSFDVIASNMVRLLATAELLGNIEAPKVAIDEGAVFEGQVKMRRAAKPATAQPAPQPAAAAPPPPPPPAPTVKPAGPRTIPELPAIGKTKLTRRTS